MRRVVLALLVVCACRGKATEGAPCSGVANRLFLIAQEDLAKATVDAKTRRAVLDQLPAMRDALNQHCTDGAWSAAVRDCLVAARDRTAFEACEAQLTDAQRRALETVTDGETPSP
jgi:hypothetical protein